MAMIARPAQGVTLSARLGNELRRAIVGGAFPPGSKLPSEAQLSEAHGVSRTVVREAIASLRADRLVEARQGAGVFVLEPQPSPEASVLALQNIDPERVSSMIEVLELRTAVEVEAAGLAAMRRSPAQEEAILDRHNAVRVCFETGVSSAEADFALHIAIAEATNNPRFRDFLAMIGKSIIPRAALSADSSERDQAAYLEMIDGEHRAIVMAISNGDEEGARDAMRRHLRGSQARYRALLHGSRSPI